MSEVSVAESTRHFGRYHDEAMRRPITITKHGRPTVVVLSAEAYERMLHGEDTRKVYLTSETPPELEEMLMATLDRDIAAYEQGQGDDREDYS